MEKIPIDDFFSKNINLVHYIAHKMLYMAKNTLVEYDDLFQIASIGMIKAYNSFDFERENNDNAFARYACKRMKGDIIRYFTQIDNDIRFPSEFYSIWKYLEISTYKVIDEEIANLFNVSKEKTEHIIKWFNVNKSYSLNVKSKRLIEDGYETELIDFLPSNQDYSIIFVNEFISKIKNNNIKEILKYLQKGYSQKEISYLIGCTQQNISSHMKKLQCKWLEYENEEMFL